MELGGEFPSLKDSDLLILTRAKNKLQVLAHETANQLAKEYSRDFDV